MGAWSMAVLVWQLFEYYYYYYYSMIRCSKKRYFEKLMTSDQKQFWKTVKVLTHRKSTIPTLTLDNEVFSEDCDKARALNAHFSRCFNTNLPPLQSQPTSYDEGMCSDLLCCNEEVEALILSLDITKSSGPDGISGRMLKPLAHEIAPSITKLLNLSIMCKRPPQVWKHSNVVPIPKKSSASSVRDYRPISLLSIISKILEKHIHMLITEHISLYSPLSAVQWGFQSGKSTELALLNTINDWLVCMEKRHDVGTVFFDFSKAFDSVPHLALLAKLRHIGLSQDLISWIHNYLSGRSQCIVVNGATSERVSVLSGVLQGSVLGPPFSDIH